MLDAIRNLGEVVEKHSGERFAFTMISDKILMTRSENRGNYKERGYLLVFNFNTKENKIEIDLPKEIEKNDLKEYLWIGNVRGSAPQNRLTTDNIEYFLLGNLYNLYKDLKDEGFKSKIKSIVDNFYINFNSKYFLDISKIEKFNVDITFIKEEIDRLMKLNLSDKELKNKISKILKDSFFKNFNEIFPIFKEKNIGLYSIKIDNKKPSEIDEYVKFIEDQLIEEQFSDSNLKGHCYVCGKESILTSDTTQFLDKYYSVKFIIFSSDLDKRNFHKNFSLCKDCYKHILIGSRFLANNLNLKLFSTNFYLIPSFIFNPLKFESFIGKFIQPLKDDINSINSLDDFLNFEKRKEEFLKKYVEYYDAKNYIYLSFLFYERDQNAFKIQKLIKDIPSRRIDELRKELEEINNFGNNNLGKDEKNWILSFDQIFYFFPIKIDKKKGAVGQRKVLDVYERILNKTKIDYYFLIKEFIEMIKVYYYSNKNTQIKISNNRRYLDIDMVRSILRSNLFLKFIKNLNLISGGEKVIENLDEYPLFDELKSYITKMDFDEQKTSMFLLGYLIGEIGKKQMNLETAKKAILDKINFNGMNLNKILILTNEVFDKLNQYNIRKYNEGIFYAMKSLLDKNINSWTLKDSENVYYILSGYAFSTNLYFIKGGKKDEWDLLKKFRDFIYLWCKNV